MRISRAASLSRPWISHVARSLQRTNVLTISLFEIGARLRLLQQPHQHLHQLRLRQLRLPQRLWSRHLDRHSHCWSCLSTRILSVPILRQPQHRNLQLSARQFWPESEKSTGQYRQHVDLDSPRIVLSLANLWLHNAHHHCLRGLQLPHPPHQMLPLHPQQHLPGLPLEREA